jgi:hypothetical protein
MHLVMIGGSDAGISAALRARELDPGADVSVVVADAFPNFSICGIPYYVSGEVTHWRNLAHRTIADLEAAGMWLRLDTTARRIDVPSHKLLVTDADDKEELLAYDRLIVGTGAVPIQPPITGLDGPGALGPNDGVHLLHSMGDTFAVVRTLENAAPASAVIVGAGYIGLEMADALTVRGLAVTQMEQLPEVLPTVDPQLGTQHRDPGPDRGSCDKSRRAHQPAHRRSMPEAAPTPPHDSPRSGRVRAWAPLQRSADHGGEIPPVRALARQRPPPGTGELIDAAPTARHHRPCAADQPSVSQPVQRGVDRPGRQVQPPIRRLAQRLHHRIPVPGAVFQCRQQQRVQMSFGLLCPHM